MITLSDDKLYRQEFLNDLFNLFDNFENYGDGGLTISINGSYGSGKSTLLNFIEEKNKLDNKYHIVKYDAWQNNFFDNPLIPILHTLNGLEKQNKIKSFAKTIVKSLPKIFISTLANAHSIDFSSLNMNENIFDEYNKYLESITIYKKILTEFCMNKKVILLVDELDRCLPQYQIRVLETLYNIFNIPNLILVIALDRNQLVHSIKQIFGNQANVFGYLSKFIQYEIDLPEDKNNSYLQTLIEFQCQYKEIKSICANMFDLANISIRDCLQIVRELNLICNEKDKNGQILKYHFWYPLFVCLVLIIKKLNRDIYKKYFYNETQIQTAYDCKSLLQTLYGEFLKDIENTRIEPVVNFLSSREMNFAFILYFINYFHPIKKVEISSLVGYTQHEQKMIENIINDFETPMWRKIEFNKTLSKIKILK